MINLIDGSASPRNIYFLSESVPNLISNNIFIYYIYQEFLFNQEKSFNIDGHVVYIKFSLCQGVMYNDVSIILADFSGRDVSTLYGDRSIQCILRKNPYSWHQQTKPLECHQYIRSRACRKDQDVNVIFHDSVTLSVSLTPCFDMANGPCFLICFFTYSAHWSSNSRLIYSGINASISSV